MSPWIQALPALIIGPITYLVAVRILYIRQRRAAYAAVIARRLKVRP
jgi:hypothetical protein